MNGPIEDCAAGLISPEVGVARLLLAGATAQGIADALARRPAHPQLAAMARLAAGRADALDRLAAEVAANWDNHDASGPTAQAGIARIAAFFDQAVAHSPEASVALYSLGDPAILAAATAEIVEWLQRHSLLHQDADVLDLGCGIGRVAAARAPRCRSVLGLDVSAGMVAEARRRHADLHNVRFEQTSGQDLAAQPAAAFDLILTIDSFPYIVQTGRATADRHVADAARILRTGGALAILNMSYRAGTAEDETDARRWAAEHGLTLRHAGERPFTIWDGTAYVLRR